MLLPDARRARCLAVIGIVALIPLQFAVQERTGQEPYPGLFLPGFATGHHDATIEVWIPRVSVVDSTGTSWPVDPYSDLLRGFPSSPTSALTNWFRAGLDADGDVVPCRRDVRAGLSQRRCAGYTRSGDAILQDAGTRSYLRQQLTKVVRDPERLIISWSTAQFEIGSTTPLALDQQIRLTVELSPS